MRMCCDMKTLLFVLSSPAERRGEDGPLWFPTPRRSLKFVEQTPLPCAKVLTRL
jgi:hypothetical protein